MIDPAQSVPTTTPITLQRAMVNAPENAPMDVPAPVIKKANAEPWLMPPSINARTSGSDASVLIYSGSPRVAASGTL